MGPIVAVCSGNSARLIMFSGAAHPVSGLLKWSKHFAPTSRNTVFVVLAGTEEFIQDIMLNVPLADLTCGNLGKLSCVLKQHPDRCPEWALLQRAAFWQDAVKHGRRWDILKGVVAKPSGALQCDDASDGHIPVATFDFMSEGKAVTKVTEWGPVACQQVTRLERTWQFAPTSRKD